MLLHTSIIKNYKMKYQYLLKYELVKFGYLKILYNKQ